MDFLKKVNVLLLGLAVLLAVGCGGDSKQDPEPENNSSGKCFLTDRATTGNGTQYSSEFIYDATGKLIRINRSYPGNPSDNSYMLITYNANGQVVKTSDFGKSSNPSFQKEFFYNVNGQPDTIIDFAGNSKTSFTTYEYNTNKQLIRTSVFNPYDSLLLQYAEFTYPGPKQSKEVRYLRNVDGTFHQDYTIENLYDNKPHPYSELGYFYDAILYSKHNLLTKTISYNGQYVNDQVFVYEYNAAGYPVKQTMTPGQFGSTTVDTFSYNCQ